VAIRDLQAKMAEVGRIRTGWKDPEQKNASKLEAFRFTSPSEAYIRRIAELYGGEPRVWKPQNNPQATQWEVFSEAKELEILVPRQTIEPWMEAWKPGTCIRRCDGYDMIVPKKGPCECRARNLRAIDACKPTVRVNMELARVPVLGWWRLDSHGWNACARLAGIAPFVQVIPEEATVPGMLILTRQTQRVVNPDGGKDQVKDFMIPWIRIDGVSTQQWQLGGSALQRAIAAAHTAAAISRGEQPALPVASEQPALPAAPATPTLDPAERHRILVAIEGCGDQPALDRIRDAMVQRGIRDPQVQASWVSRQKSLQAAQQIEQRAITSGLDEPPEWDPGYDDAPYSPDSDPAYDEPVHDRGQTVAEPDGPAAEDPSVEYFGLVTLAGALGWSTADLNDRIVRTLKIEEVAQATAQQLREVAGAIQRGDLK